MELYKQYLKERENIDCVYDDSCFITYKLYDDNTAVIIDIYSIPEIRGQQKMKDFVEILLDELKEKEISTVFGMTVKSANGCERSEELMKKFGFKFLGLDPKDKDIKNYYLDLL